MKFVKGQWYQYKEHFWQYEDRCFRYAGDEIPVKNLSYANKLTPASLTPDFSNAKEGDECFSAADGVSVITEITNGYYIDIEGNDYAFYANGRYGRDDKHPTLFNSFAQFLAYWQEEALKLKGGE